MSLVVGKERFARAVGNAGDKRVERLVVLDEVGMTGFDIRGGESVLERGGEERDAEAAQGLIGFEGIGDDVGAEFGADVGLGEGIAGEGEVAAADIELDGAALNIERGVGGKMEDAVVGELFKAEKSERDDRRGKGVGETTKFGRRRERIWFF